MNASKILSLLVILFLPVTSGSQSQPDPDIHEFIADLEESLGFSGSILVAVPEGIMFQNGTGLANRNWDIPNSVDTKYLIASLTKPMTAALVLKLVESGEIRLNDTLNELLPEYPAEYSSQVTVLQLLKHKSGIPNFSALPGWFDGEYLNSIPAIEFASQISELSLEFEPGTSRKYSNSNYLILGLIIQSVTGQQYSEYLTESIFDPAQMNDSGVLSKNTDVISKLAANYQVDEESRYREGGFVNFEHFVASGSNYSTVGDLFKWTEILLNGDLLHQDSLDAMFDPDDPIAWDVSQVQTSTNSSSLVIVGDGELEGYAGMIMMIPDSNISVVLLNNNGLGYRGLLDFAQRIVGFLVSR